MRAASLASVLLSASAAFAGPLVPSAGPVASTMKPLDEVEPRIAINAVNTPGDANSLFRITQPGSYYLTGNLQGVAGKAGIEVAANNVTIDLGGFEVRGVADSFDGVNTEGTRTGLAIRNGAVSGWGGDGVRWNFVSCVIVSNLRVLGNTGNGIAVGDTARVSECTIKDNGGAGLSAGGGVSIVTEVASYSNDGVGFHIQSNCSLSACSAVGNGGRGFSANFTTTFNNCVATGNGEDGFWAQANCTVMGCTATNNYGSGIRSNAENIITGNICTDNGFSTADAAGIHIVGSDNRVEGNTVSGNDRGIDCDVAGNFIVRNSASGNMVSYSITGTQTMGPVITATGVITTSNPWANFEY
jgi:parallel beta-helix repeat protein